MVCTKRAATCVHSGTLNTVMTSNTCKMTDSAYLSTPSTLSTTTCHLYLYLFKLLEKKKYTATSCHVTVTSRSDKIAGWVRVMPKRRLNFVPNLVFSLFLTFSSSSSSLSSPSSSPSHRRRLRILLSPMHRVALLNSTRAALLASKAAAPKVMQKFCIPPNRTSTDFRLYCRMLAFSPQSLALMPQRSPVWPFESL